MIRRSPVPLLFAALSISCATSPAATPAPATAPPPATQAAQPPPAAPAAMARPAALNPVGTYDFTATLPDGSMATGSFTIAGSPGAYTGTITREGEGTATQLSDIAVDGQWMTLATVIPDGNITFSITFNGPEFTGKWSVQGAEGAFNGKRR